MKKVLLWVWQLPQHLLGLLVILFSRAIDNKINFPEKYQFYETKCKFGVSLGEYRIINKNCSTNTMKHEYGHTIQSRILGPLYLILIGLPSAIGNIIHRIRPKGKGMFDYYKQPWEKWADILGGVVR